jgi:hypothetical protein
VSDVQDELDDLKRCRHIDRRDRLALLDLVRDEPETIAVRERIRAGQYVDNPLTETVGSVIRRLIDDLVLAEDALAGQREVLAMIPEQMARAWDEGHQAATQYGFPRINPYRA